MYALSRNMKNNTEFFVLSEKNSHFGGKIFYIFERVFVMIQNTFTGNWFLDLAMFC